MVETSHFQSRDVGSTPRAGTKIPNAMRHGQKKKKKKKKPLKDKSHGECAWAEERTVFL